MNILLDTHVVVWAFSEPARIPQRIRRLIETDAESISVSHVTLWEIAMKYPLARRDAPPRSAPETLQDVAESGFSLLPLDLGHILAFERLPRLSGDPFDRILVAQALSEGLRFVTHDSELDAYGDAVISW